MSTITVIILTYNEEIHIERCIRSVLPFASKIYVVDSFSTDKTIEIASGFDVTILQNRFINQAHQFNWALDVINPDTDWVFRIDADEFVVNPDRCVIQSYLEQLPVSVSGLIIKRKIIFLGRPLLHGGWYPKWNMRFFRSGKGRSEFRWMDEHIVLSEGDSMQWNFDIVDDNLNSLNWWTTKHNNYSDREVLDYFLSLETFEKDHSVRSDLFGNDAERKRWLKSKYHSIPLFFRPFLNFIYRYIIRLGFLDGKQGLIWHFLQGFWYRFLVDAKIYELKRQFGGDSEQITEYLKSKFHI